MSPRFSTEQRASQVNLLLEDCPSDAREIDAFHLEDDGSPRDVWGQRRTSRTRCVPSRWLKWMSQTAAGRCENGNCACIQCGKQGRRGLSQWCLLMGIGAFALLGVIQLLALIRGIFVPPPRLKIPSILEDWSQIGKNGDGLRSWPTDFTRDIKPIPCHSHNDYWRKVPLYSALSAGCISVEADVWLIENELFVGHNRRSLTPSRTLHSLYTGPILEILDRQNVLSNLGNENLAGVFDTDPSQTLILLIDFKTDGEELWSFVSDALKPLRSKGYLSYWDGDRMVEGCVTVVGTGNAPFEYITSDVHNPHHDIFFDAPLDQLWVDPEKDEANDRVARPEPVAPAADRDLYGQQNSYYASVAFGKTIGRMWSYDLSAEQLTFIRGQVKGAHARGLKVRYWEQPDWPIGLRNHMWKVLYSEGADILNADDLYAITREDWGSL